MTEGTHQPLTIEEVRLLLRIYETQRELRARDGYPERTSQEERALRMLVAAWEATEPKSPFSLGLDSERRNGYLDALDDIRRAIFGGAGDEGR